MGNVRSLAGKMDELEPPDEDTAEISGSHYYFFIALKGSLLSLKILRADRGNSKGGRSQCSLTTDGVILAMSVLFNP